MKKDKAFIKYFEVGPYPVWLGFSDNKNLYEKEMKRLAIADIPEFDFENKSACVHSFIKNGELNMIVTISIQDQPLDKICGLIIHEAVHVWQNIIDFIDEKNPGIEIEAYHIQNIAQAMIYNILVKNELNIKLKVE